MNSTSTPLPWFQAVSLRRGVAALAIAGAVAACGGGAQATTAPTTAAATTPPAATGSAAPMSEAPAAEVTLELASSEDGEYVAGEGGMALYIFTPDAAAPGTSTCNGECATNWPPLVVDDVADVAAGEGVTGEIGTVTRDDGGTQVTLGGNPLYYFAGDEAEGDTNGQGLNDVWWLAGPDGEGVGAPSTANGRGNY